MKTRLAGAAMVALTLLTAACGPTHHVVVHHYHHVVVHHYHH